MRSCCPVESKMPTWTKQQEAAGKLWELTVVPLNSRQETRTSVLQPQRTKFHHKHVSMEEDPKLQMSTQSE